MISYSFHSLSILQVAKQCNAYQFDTLVSMNDKQVSWEESLQNDQKALSKSIWYCSMIILTDKFFCQA